MGLCNENFICLLFLCHVWVFPLAQKTRGQGRCGGFCGRIHFRLFQKGEEFEGRVSIQHPSLH